MIKFLNISVTLYKIIVIIFIIILFFIPKEVLARAGCCSNNGGVCGCSKYGQVVCCNNRLSKSCRCEAPIVYGCTDHYAINYDDNANKDDGSCMYDETSKEKKDNENKAAWFIFGFMLFISLLFSPTSKKIKRR